MSRGSEKMYMFTSNNTHCHIRTKPTSSILTRSLLSRHHCPPPPRLQSRLQNRQLGFEFDLEFEIDADLDFDADFDLVVAADCYDDGAQRAVLRNQNAGNPAW